MQTIPSMESKKIDEKIDSEFRRGFHIKQAETGRLTKTKQGGGLGKAITGVPKELVAPDKSGKRVCGSKGRTESATPGSMWNYWVSGMDKNGET